MRGASGFVVVLMKKDSAVDPGAASRDTSMRPHSPQKLDP
jgi:hypothetical protein